jgi:4-amino-4-deoxy-L-arabinose transferase-like glycosyltransferase
MHVFKSVRNLTILLTLLFLAGYALTRLTNLANLPIFTDEAIYIRWSQIGAQDANWRFISLTDGKQPMFTWVTMMLLRLVPGDPLFSGRLTSVLAGLGTMIGIWLLSYELFRRRSVAWVSAFVYLISPFTLWYDRFAIYDSMVAMFSVWSLYLAVGLVRKLTLDRALILGMVLGAGMLNKTSGFLSLYLLPFTLLLFDWGAHDRMKRLVKWIGLAVIAAAISQLFYSVLRLSPFFYIIAQKDNVFVFSIGEWLSQPFRFFAGNLRGMSDWVRTYMTLPLFVAALIPLFTRWPKALERLLLYAWFSAPFVLLANFGKVLYPRFVLFMTLPLLVVAAESATRMLQGTKRFWIRVALIVLLFIPSIAISYKIITDPLHAPIPISDRSQYVEDWPSGWGVPEVVSYIDAKAKEGPVAVYTEGTFGLFPYALEIYLVDKPNIHIEGIWPLPAVFSPAIIESAKHRPTYFVTNQTQDIPQSWPLELIGTYQKGTREGVFMRLYQVVPKPLSSL